MVRLVVALVAALALVPAAARAETRHPLLGEAAPPWEAAAWDGAAEDAPAPELARLRGRVVLLYVVVRLDEDVRAQALPALRAVERRYALADDVAVLVVHAPHERTEETATPAAMREALAEAGLDVPLGHAGPAFFRRYVPPLGAALFLIDRRGVVRAVEPLAPHFARTSRDVDAVRGRSLSPIVGQPFPDLEGFRWMRPGRPVRFADSPLTLVRWWTTSCSFCTASVPALARLAARHDGLRLLGVYHRKGPVRSTDDALLRYADRLGHRGAVAEDVRWRVLRPMMRRAGFTRATSVSFLVDRDGIVRWAHAGPRLHGDEGGRHARAAADLRALDAAVRRLLAD